MAELDIIDAEVLPAHIASSKPSKPIITKPEALLPVYTAAERRAALQLLSPSPDEAILGAGWTDSEAASDEEGATSTSSASSPSTPTFPSTVSDNLALLVRSCSQGWSLSFELHPFHPIPSPSSPDEVLIRNDAVGLNPVDWKSVSYNFGIPAFPWILGRDIAGTIIQLPANNEKGWKVGDRVWTCADSRQLGAGGYQRFSVHQQRTLAKVPEMVTDEEAATLGTGLITAAVALFALFKLPHFDNATGDRLTRKFEVVDQGDRDWIVIYGGGAITGLYAIQLARLSSLNVIAVASPSNFAYLTSLGATACIDRHQPPSSILSSISTTLASRAAEGKLRYALDCVSSTTADICLQALQQTHTPHQGEMVCLAGNPTLEQHGIKLHRISFSSTFYHPNGVFAQQTLDYLTALLEQTSLKPARAEVVPDGLAGIRSGLELLREGKAPRAKKLVIRVADTPAADVTLLGVKSELGWNGAV